MTYEEFKQNFLPEFLNIKSFAGRIKYASQYLTRIGSGSGRIVYDIDGQRVLKLARNTKGVAQNEVEAGAGYYRDTQHIVAEIFDSAEDDSWLIAEKAKKVNEKRIIQLTGIPSLNELYYYLKNREAEDKNRRPIFGQKEEVKNFLDNNEFAHDLIDFAINYNQNVGDMGKPSTYGEVLHDGQPSIVLTDYGVNDEVFDTHYSSNGKQRVYELYNFADGNDDMLSDLPPQDAVDTHRAMWALMPYGVGDGDDVINEKFVNFVKNRNKYPSKPVLNLPVLADGFQECVNNLKETLNHVDNKSKFYNNLLALQDYLIAQGFYDREPLQKEEYELNSKTKQPLTEDYDRSTADVIANKIAELKGYNKPVFIGGGNFGVAYDIGGDKILKITKDNSEAAENHMLIGKPLEYIAQPYNVFIVTSRIDDIPKTFAIVLEKLKTDQQKLKRLRERMDFIFKNILNLSFYDVIDFYVYDYGNIDTKKIDNYMSKNLEDAEFFYGILKIVEECKKYGIQSLDYVSYKNLGYKKNGNLGFFDVGFGNGFLQPRGAENIDINEDGSSKFSTPNSFGQDNFPPYVQDDTSPIADNNVPTDDEIHEDLEYHHVVGDATQDKFAMDERVKSFMPNSQSVEVKQKCRLGGNGNTSTACNQGDINNLNLKSIDEQSLKDFEKQIEKDNKDNKLDKLLLYQEDDYKVCAINGDYVRSKNPGLNFDEWVDGGHHYVDLDSPKNEQKYAKHIPEDEIWVDDVFLIKPSDLGAILLHETLERHLMKYYGLKYSNDDEGKAGAHEIANKAEVEFREKVKNGFGHDVSQEIYNRFVENYAKEHPKKKLKINESIMYEDNTQQNKITEFVNNLKQKPFIKSLINNGGEVFAIGGVVRDLILNKPNKDIDLVVRNTPIDSLISQLQKFGKVDVVGKSFGVIKFVDVNGTDYDVALPRVEKINGEGGYHGFDVQSDENLPIEDDLSRRDSKMNAMAININTGKFIDPLGGLEDIKNKQISAANPQAFSDDPLRMMRMIGFASRFGFTIEPKTMQMIKDNANRIKEIPPERILTEFDKIIKNNVT